MPRAKAFSGKAKKQQLQAKKNRNIQGTTSFQKNDYGQEPKTIFKIHQRSDATRDSTRYALHFYRESDEELKKRKEEASKAIISLKEEALEISDEYFVPELTFPKRPPWDYNMKKGDLNLQENIYFNNYLCEIQDKFDSKELGYFELNLETWRQLWRVIEMSDIILLVVDIRFPTLMFPPSLYDYVTKTLKKDFILILNKIDLCPRPLILAWEHYFKEKYPNLYILFFSSFSHDNGQSINSNEKIFKSGRPCRKLKMAAEWAQKLLDVCKTIVNDKVDLSSWSEKIKEEKENEYENDEIEIENNLKTKQFDTTFEDHQKFKNGTLTIGCLGTPNVGKSSLINAIMGKKVVSVSKTPGHTKHFQTICLTSTVRLCDCPGLIFPSKVPKNLQVFMGVYPISQLREPFSAIQFIAQRKDLPKLLNLPHPDNEIEWSAMDICEAWAIKRGFHTGRGAKSDIYRAANHLLRLITQGKLNLCFTPPKYSEEKDKYMSDEGISCSTKTPQASRNKNDLLDDNQLENENLSDDEDILENGHIIEEEIESDKEEEIEPDKEEEIESDNEEEDNDFCKFNKFALLAD